jgi:hypothetical protein
MGTQEIKETLQDPRAIPMGLKRALVVIRMVADQDKKINVSRITTLIRVCELLVLVIVIFFSLLLLISFLFYFFDTC